MPKLTKAQRAWLERLRDEGVVVRRPRGSAACICARRGWADWVTIDKTTGQEVTNGEWRALVNAGCGCDVKIIGERITPAGRAALEGGDDA